jgi:hypothetical protein
MKVVVCHFVSNSHEAMTALILVLPLIVVVEISLQLHQAVFFAVQSARSSTKIFLCLPEGFIFYSMCLIYNLSNDCEQDLKSDV